MNLRSFFSAAQAVQARAPDSAAALAYQARVTADGGAVFSLAAVQQAYARAASWGLDPALTHWSSPQFGVRLAPDGTVNKRYCLFGSDAEPVTPGRHWTAVEAPGLPPQHLVGEANRGFRIPAFLWATRALTVVAACTQTTYSTTAGIPFFPLIEHSPNCNDSTSFVLGIDTTIGNNAGGVTTPYTIRSVPTVSPLGHQNCFTLVVDPSQNSTLDQLVFCYNTMRAESTPLNKGLSTLPYDHLPVFLGQRGQDGGYYWAGTINDVFYTAQVLPDSARAWLENQRWCYDSTLPRPGDTVPSTDARWQELAGYWGTVDYTDQPLVRYAEPGNAGRADIGFYGKRLVVEHSSFGPVRGHFYVDDVETTAFEVNGPGETTEIVCDTLDYHTLSLRQDPSEGYAARGILHVYAS